MARTRSLSINCDNTIGNTGLYNNITNYTSITPDNILIEKRTKNIISAIVNPGTAILSKHKGTKYLVNEFTSRAGIKSIFATFVPKSGKPNSSAVADNPTTLYLAYSKFNINTNTYSSDVIFNDSYITIPTGQISQTVILSNLIEIIPDSTYTRYKDFVVYSNKNLVSRKAGQGLSVTLEYFGE